MRKFTVRFEDVNEDMEPEDRIVTLQAENYFDAAEKAVEEWDKERDRELAEDGSSVTVFVSDGSGIESKYVVDACVERLISYDARKVAK